MLCAMPKLRLDTRIGLLAYRLCVPRSVGADAGGSAAVGNGENVEEHGSIRGGGDGRPVLNEAKSPPPFPDGRPNALR